MRHRLRRSQLVEFGHVAAGHEGVMADQTGVVIVKPCHQSEIDFYETTVLHPQFRAYIPEYIGTLAIDQETAAANASGSHFRRANHAPTRSQSALLEPVGSAPLAATVPETWVPSGGRRINAERGVVLENIAHGFTRPNILDVKLGARLWADDAPLEKRQRLDKVAAESTSGSLGFRIAGMKIWQGPEAGDRFQNLEGYLKHDKNYGRTFSKTTVSNAFEEYFFLQRPDSPRNRMRKIIKRFIEDLKGLVEALEGEESRMYSASLLFIYEGDWVTLGEKFQTERAMMEDDHVEVSSGPVVAPEGEQVNGEVNVTGTIQVTSPIASPTDGSNMGPALGESDSDSEPRLPRIQTLKMIDFAHANWTPGEGQDENILRGIRNVVKILEELVAS